MGLLACILLLLAVGSGVYCLLVVVAARKYLSVQPPPLTTEIPLSVLKPLAGFEAGLESNLRTIFVQEYANYEIVFAVRTESDPAVPVVRRLLAEYPSVSARLLLVGEPPYANAKVWSLERMTAAAAHDILVMSDSDIRVKPNFLGVIAAEFADPRVGVSSCPCRAVPGQSSFPSTLEAIGMNTEFLSTALVARMIEGMKFALGPTLTARKQVIADVGGWPHLAEFLAEDFVLGNTAAGKGWTVLFSSYVVEHHIGAQTWQTNITHRLRWNRSTRRSRPGGYIGQLFTNPLPLVLLLLLVRPEWWLAGLAVTAVRLLAAYAVAGRVLHDPLTRGRPYLVPVQDILSFGFWVAGFFGNDIQWRGRRYELLPDGRFRLRVNRPAEH